jgi:hypothetical protein
MVGSFRSVIIVVNADEKGLDSSTDRITAFDCINSLPTADRQQFNEENADWFA